MQLEPVCSKTAPPNKAPVPEGGKLQNCGCYAVQSAVSFAYLLLLSTALQRTLSWAPFTWSASVLCER